MGHMGHDGLFILLKISEMSYAQRFIVEPKKYNSQPRIL